MKKIMFLSKNWYFSVQKALIYYTVNKSHHNSFILLVFSHVANFRFLTLPEILIFKTVILRKQPISVHSGNLNSHKYTKFGLTNICKMCKKTMQV